MTYLQKLSLGLVDEIKKEGLYEFYKFVEKDRALYFSDERFLTKKAFVSRYGSLFLSFPTMCSLEIERFSVWFSTLEKNKRRLVNSYFRLYNSSVLFRLRFFLAKTNVGEINDLFQVFKKVTRNWEDKSFVDFVSICGFNDVFPFNLSSFVDFVGFSFPAYYYFKNKEGE